MKRTFHRWSPWAVCITGLVAGCVQSDRPMVFVAASLADVAAAWEAGYAGGFEIHTGASYLLANQIHSGAKADLFLAAGTDPLSQLLAAGMVQRVDSHFLGNRLVLVCSPGVKAPDSLQELLHPRFARIAVADPELAPAGKYARTGLQKAGLWDALKPRMIFTGDVRMAAETVRLATADAAFVYATDVLDARGIMVLDTLLFPLAVYPLAMTSESSPELESLWVYLHTAEARKMASDRGFR